MEGAQAQQSEYRQAYETRINVNQDYQKNLRDISPMDRPAGKAVFLSDAVQRARKQKANYKYI